MGRTGLAGVVALAFVLALGACSGDDSDGDSQPSTPNGAGVPEGAPREYADHPDDWVLPGRDYDNSRSADSEITADNADTLKVAWEADVSGPLSTVPLIVGDTIYVQDGSGAIHAFARDSGKRRWKVKGTGFSIGPFGAAVANGRVFGLHSSKGVVALAADTGKVLWRREITATPSTGIDIQPVVHDDLVFVSTVPISIGGIYKGGDRGIVHALKASTGADVWTFDTVQDADLWGNAEVNSGGGAWYPPAIDPTRGSVYWGVANPAPFPGTEGSPNGSSRPGPNLYTDSVVALDLKSGELRWYHQVTPHDIFDRDLVHTLIARGDDGEETLVATGKAGLVVGLAPQTGEERWITPVGVHKNDELTDLEGPTEVAPGTYGGVLTPPATADGIVYVATVDSPVVLKPNETAYFGAEMGENDGEVTAVDATTGEKLWETDVPGDPLGGVIVVNDLVFTATLQGKLVALDRSDGEIVWDDDLPGDTNGWMSAAGDLLVVPVGGADPPRLVAYRLP